MPVWTPGSYKVREFAQNVEHFEAMGEKELRVDRIDKSTWRIQCKGEKEISVKYEVYCFVVSVRQSYVDQYHAFCNTASCSSIANASSIQDI
jgi:predicted metalloprotease with PDZ domain